MGVTIDSEHYSCDLGCAGFNRFRNKVAELSSKDFFEHYKRLDDADVQLLSGEEREKYFKKYDMKTLELINDGKISVEVANFCLQSDCSGEINQEQAKQIYENIKDYDDNICYGYCGREDCAMFKDLKQIFKDCVISGGSIEWI